MRAGRMLTGALSLVLALIAGPLAAQSPEKPAEESVIEGVRAVVSVVEKYSGDDAAGGRQAYLDEVTDVLDPRIGYTVIVSRIMGDALSEASREQKIRFLNVFKRSMVRTYAGGLYNFGTFEVTLLPQKGGHEDTVRDTRVHLQVITPEGQRYPMVYSVYYSQSNERWKIQNVIFNGINLGLTFQRQFQQIYRDNNGDLDATISDWEEHATESFEPSDFK